MELPLKFVERVVDDLGEREGAALCASLDGEPVVSVRLNPAKTGNVLVVPAPFSSDATGCCAGAETASGNEAGLGGEGGAASETAPADVADDVEVRLQPFVAEPVTGKLEVAEPVPWCAEGRYLAARPSFTRDTDFHAGAYYVQEASSQFVGHLLRGVPTVGARILDLCAAPGGKTTLYASLVGPDGLVVANEIDRRRAQVLADNVRKWGTGNVVVTACEPRAVCDFEAWFDVVAVDAPCSGEGMFRKDTSARVEWSESNVCLCTARQEAILHEAWRALKPGGTLLYSTCTFNRDENEGSLERMVEWAGEELAEAGTIPVDVDWGVVCGRTGAFQTFRFYPHKARGEGFFAAVACKAFDAGGRCRTPKGRRQAVTVADRNSEAELRRWVREPEWMRFGVAGDTFYGWYADQAEAVRMLAGALPVIYSGVAMGQLFKGRLKPDPALAFFAGLDRRAVPVVELDDATALRYLRKQEIGAELLAEGMNLVCTRGRALGFAKRIGSRVNNLYPNTLRIMKQ